MKLSWYITILTLGSKYRSGGISIALKTFKEWHTNTKLAFLNYLSDNKNKINEKIAKNLKNELNLSEDYNSEIKYMWYLIALDKKMEEEIPNIQNFWKLMED